MRIKKINYDRQSIFVLGFILLAFVFIYSIATAELQTDQNLARFELSTMLNKGISLNYLEDGAEVNKQVTLPTSIKTNQPYTVTLDLSSYGDVNGKAISLYFSYLNFDVYVDGNNIYSHWVKNNSIVRSGGYLTHIVKLPTKIEDKHVIIKVFPILESVHNQKLATISIGAPDELVMSHFWRELSIIIVSLMMIFFFIIIVILLILQTKLININRKIIVHLSLLSFILGLYFLTQLWIVNYALRNIHLIIYYIEYTVLILLGVPFLLIIHNRFNPKYNRLIRINLYLSLTFAILQNILTTVGIVEFKELLWLSHLFLIMQAFFITAIIFLADGSKYPEKKKLLFSLIPLVIGQLVAIYSYIVSGVVYYTELMMFYLIVFTSMHLRSAIQHYRTLHSEKLKNEIYRELAIFDSLTGVKSRTAFNEFIEELSISNCSGWVVSIDLNNLKPINDQYGHLAGDAVLKHFGKLLSAHGKSAESEDVFRMGGDEFLTFIKSTKNFDIQVWMNNLEEVASNLVIDDHTHGISFAIGAEYYQANRDNFEKIMDTADQKMYQYKANQRV